MGKRYRNFLIVIREGLRRHHCFCWNWKRSSFDRFFSKYFGWRPLPSWHLRQWCNTARCCVSFIRCGLFISEVFIWNNYLKVFPRFCAAKEKPTYSYSWISLLISIIWLPQGYFWATDEGTAWLNKNQSLVPPKW